MSAAARAGAPGIALSAETTRGEALDLLRRAFAQAGIAEAALDARILLGEAGGLSAAALIGAPERPLGADVAARLAAYAEVRLARMPVSRILARAEFWSLPFALSPETLTPRPDTETLVEAALALHPGAQARVLDLGTGSGCILVALLHERPGWRGLGLDRSEDAARTARANAAANGVGDRAAFVVSDWLAPLAAGPLFDVIVSNPPYIPAADIAGLDADVREHDPMRALDGGRDGLDAYRTLLTTAPAHLTRGGALALEVGSGQADAVARLGATAGLVPAGIRRDLAGKARVVCFRGTGT